MEIKSYYDLEIIASNKYTKRELCEALKINEKELNEIIKKFGINYKGPKYRYWTKEDDKKLEELKKNGYKAPYIAYKLDRDIKNIYQRIVKLNLSGEKDLWTKEEIKHLIFLRKYQNSYRDIAFILDRTRNACMKKYYECKRKGLVE